MLIVGGGRDVGKDSLFRSHLVLYTPVPGGENRECYGGFFPRRVYDKVGYCGFRGCEKRKLKPNQSRHRL